MLLKIGKLGSIVSVIMLFIAFMADLGYITVTGYGTADSYYEPLKELPLGDLQKEAEKIIIKTHVEVMYNRRIVWFYVHLIALLGASIGCYVLWCIPTGPKKQLSKGIKNTEVS